ncbi:hypothetical protein D3C81_1902400 [compost metagenome]
MSGYWSQNFLKLGSSPLSIYCFSGRNRPEEAKLLISFMSIWMISGRLLVASSVFFLSL